MLKNLFLSERNMMVAILINAVIIFTMYFPAYREDPLLEIIDHLFIVFFLVEAVVKIWVLKPNKYFENGWNRFDFAIIIGSLPSLLVQIVPIPDTSLLLILRLFRLVRMALPPIQEGLFGDLTGCDRPPFGRSCPDL